MTSAPHRRSVKKTLRAVGAASVSAALVGVLALPAYASSFENQSEAQTGFAQVLTTNDSADIVIPAHMPLAEVQPATAVVERVTSSATSNPVSISLPRDIPSGVGASGIINGALAQIGIHQDCTDLVQNSLAAAGYVSRRDAGVNRCACSRRHPHLWRQQPRRNLPWRRHGSSRRCLLLWRNSCVARQRGIRLLTARCAPCLTPFLLRVCSAKLCANANEFSQPRPLVRQ